MHTVCQVKLLRRTDVAQSAVRIVKKAEILTAGSGAIQGF